MVFLFLFSPKEFVWYRERDQERHFYTYKEIGSKIAKRICGHAGRIVDNMTDRSYCKRRYEFGLVRVQSLTVKPFGQAFRVDALSF
jgi:hypothetical protein